MAQFKDLRLSDGSAVTIEWDMTPDLAFCMFTAKGLRKELSNSDERVCYCFIDNYGDIPKLYLVERGSRFVNIIAEIAAPNTLLTECITRQGQTLNVKDNFPVDVLLKEWIIDEVIEKENSSVLFPIILEKESVEDMGEVLPQSTGENWQSRRLVLPDEPCQLTDGQVEHLIQQWGFADQIFNQQSDFTNHLVDSGDALTVIDERTGLMWQRFGLDLCSIRNMKNKIEELNTKGFAEYHDWRMPTVEEALSLMEAKVNDKGVYLHPCFSIEQPFIFTLARRKPTGYWFVDYKQGKIYWSSGTVPGGFCRLCRKIP
jgi:Protein of unknown function (DUF1566)